MDEEDDIVTEEDRIERAREQFGLVDPWDEVDVYYDDYDDWE